MKKRLVLIFVLFVFTIFCKAQGSIVYWKRYTSIDLFAVGVPVYNPNFYQYDQKPFAMELLSIHVGLLKVDYTPFLNFAIESEADLSFWNQEGYTMLSMRVGTFIYKSEKLESTIATGFAWNPDGNNASTSLLRFVFKPRKWFGIGVSINTNVNKDRFAAGGRVLINFSNDL